MKKILSAIIVCTTLMTANIPTVVKASTYREFYVSVNGSDTNSGTSKAEAFQTLKAAQEAVRLANDNMTGDIIVNILDGTYYLDSMLDLGVEDSGTNGYDVIWKGAGSQKSVISGGKKVSGFFDSDGDGIYTADLSGQGIDYVYQLSVNGLSRQMAKGATLVYGQKNASGEYYFDDPAVDLDGDINDKPVAGTYGESDNVSTGEQKGSYVPAEKYPDRDGLYVSKTNLGMFERADDMFFMWNRGFYGTAVPVEKIENESDTLLKVTMCYGWYDSLVENEPAKFPSSHVTFADRAFAILNALELLDEPGEFYFNRDSKELHYMPVKGEDMSTATVVVPMIDTLVCIDGNDIDDKAENITFTNLEFTSTKWNIENGFINGQSDDYSGNGQSSIAPCAVFVERASNISFIDNVFSNIGANGINYYNAVDHSVISQNAFYDIGATAILSGARSHDYTQLLYDENSGTSTVDKNTTGDRSAPVPTTATDGVNLNAIDLVAQATTKTTVSSGYGAESGPVLVVAGHQHIWYNKFSSNAITYPGNYPSVNDGTWILENSYYKLNTTHIDYNLTSNKSQYSNHKGIWQSTPDIEEGNSFVKFEFIRPYTISQISVSLHSKYATNDHKVNTSNFEILVSNDESFKTYKTWATQEKQIMAGTSASGVTHYANPDNDTTKYKYVMIRKLNKEPLALSRIWIATEDRAPYVKYQRCDNNTISNNLVDRAGINTYHSMGITITSASNYNVTHNEINHTGYSGISIGYAWQTNRTTCKNMNVSYNRIYDSCRTSHDGGGIYTLGAQPGSVYENNYIETTNQGCRGIYTDNGSSQFIIRNNYIENAPSLLGPYTGSTRTASHTDDGVAYTCYVYKDVSTGELVHRHDVTEDNVTTYTFYNCDSSTGHHTGVYEGDTSLLKARSSFSGIEDVTYVNNYGTHTIVSDSAKAFNEFEVPHLELIGLPSAGAYDTYTNAGLSQGAQYLYDLVPENIDGYYEDSDYDAAEWRKGLLKSWSQASLQSFSRNLFDEFTNLVESGKFGNGLGMYPIEYRDKINNMRAFYSTAERYLFADSDFIERLSIMNEFRKDLKDSVRRYSVEETIAMCDELIAGAEVATEDKQPIGSYPQAAVTAAQTALANVRSMSQSTPQAYQQKLVAAEKVYNNLQNSCYAAEIIYVNSPDVKRVDINPVEDKVTLYLNPGVQKNSVSNVNFVTDSNSMLYRLPGESLDLTNDIKVPVLCLGNNKFRMWTVTAQFDAENNSDISMYDWTALADGKERIRYGNGFATLAGSNYVYTATTNGGTAATTINFKPYAKNSKPEMSIILGLKNYENVYYDKVNYSEDWIELVLSGSTATVYKVVGGERIAMQEKSSPMNWNGDNTLSYTVSGSNITIDLNGETFTATANYPLGHYAGIYTPNMSVAVH